MYVRALLRRLPTLAVAGLLAGHASGLGAQPLCDKQASSQRSEGSGLFDVYEENRTRGIPNLITTDLFLVGYDGIAALEQTRIEAEQALPLLRRIISGLEVGLQGLPNQDGATSLNRQFVTVLSALAGDRTEGVTGADQQELQLVRAANGISRSPLFGYPLDYSQLRPRGAYTKDANTAQYFVVSRYASTVLFHVVASHATGVDAHSADQQLVAAEQLARLLTADNSLGHDYAKLLGLFDDLVGPPDDLPASALLQGQQSAPKANSAGRRAAVLAYVKAHDLFPVVLGEVVDAQKLESGMSAYAVSTGWRLLPARRTGDSAALQSLVHSGVNDFAWTHPDSAREPPFLARDIGGTVYKVFPSVLEIGAALNSNQALHALAESGSQQFAEFTPDTRRPYQRAAALLASEAPLAGARLLVLRSLWADGDVGFRAAPAFWTLERHRQLLYAKQSYTVTGKGFVPTNPPSVRPGAAIDADVGALLALKQLVDVQLAMAPGSTRWSNFGQILDRAINIRQRSLLTQRLAPADDEYLNSLDLELRELTRGKDAPVVVDVHVDPGSARALYEATGLPDLAFTDSCAQRGARLTHYEFAAPMSPRLSDEDWKATLEDGDFGRRQIALAPWTHASETRHHSVKPDAVDPPAR